MIFFDRTGKRWKKIKVSAAGMAALVITPVAVLIVGSLAYQPHWGQLPLVGQASSLLSGAAGLAAQVSSAATKPTPRPSASSSPGPKPIASVRPKAAAGTTAVLSAQTTPTPRVTTTPAPTATPAASTAPGKSGTHSHPTPTPR